MTRVAIVTTVAALLAVALAAVTAVYGLSTNRQTGVTNATLGGQIQRERARSLRDSCLTQNARNSAAVEAINATIAAEPSRARAAARRGRAGDIQVVNALAPVQDCDALVRRRFP